MSLVNTDLIRVGMIEDSAESSIRTLAGMMLDAGLVRDSFAESVISREKTHPTGIPARVFDIAIPHTMAEHVICPGMAVGVLTKAVEWRQMGSPDIILHPQVIFMLAISDASKQIGQLKKIMKLIQSDNLLTMIKNALHASEVADLLAPVLTE